MERKISLNGSWELYFSDEIKCPVLSVENYKKAEHIKATVPGNCELDLSAAGLLPKDIFKGMGTVEAEKCEAYGYWYETTFETPDFFQNETVKLHFGAVDCIAEYYLNGKLIHTSDNAFIEQNIDITGFLKKGKKNTLVVHIASCVKAEFETQYDCFTSQRETLCQGVYLRKPRHSFGWDIFPRAVSAGIWREVSLVISDEYKIESVYNRVIASVNGNTAVHMYVTVNAPSEALFYDELTIKVLGRCGEDSKLTGKATLKKSKGAKIICNIENPKLWWPYGYGEANIYDTEVALCKGDTVLATTTLNIGLREIKLDRTETLEEENPRFRFIVNGVPIFCRGSNWVPVDAYHSRDKERYQKALEMASDVGCNMLRVWGGGVYEDEEFYDYCDRHGILVWQDFMMACQVTPMNKGMMASLENEFTYIIKKLRNHPCLALWSGDNEIDQFYISEGLNPDENHITRELLPRLIKDNDPYRSYLPSSPYIPGKNVSDYLSGKEILVEHHLWGPRDYFKSDYYKNSKACFVSETGYHGCPSVETVKKTVDEDKVWPIYNEQWTLHSSDQRGNMRRVELMDNQIYQLFGKKMDNLEDFVFASQISQAEAKKYFIERLRVKKPYTGGILWWNLIDGWPQMSDAVVDYFYDKKIAYYYIRRSQAPFSIMIDEMRSWSNAVVAVNDTLKEITGNYQITDIETDEVIKSGEFSVASNGISRLGQLPKSFYCERRMLLIKWEIDGKTYYNHYLCGQVPFDIDMYKKCYEKLSKLYID